MTAAPGSPAVGYYGKLPSRGDFITQRLAAAFPRLGPAGFELVDDMFHADGRNRWTPILAYSGVGSPAAHRCCRSGTARQQKKAV